MRTMFLAATLLSAVVLAADTEPEAEALSPVVRHFLHRRMERHGDDMTKLVRAVVLFDRRSARSLATDIANEPRLARPLSGDDAELNAQLPSRFFALQDELRQRAKTLVSATTSSDPTVLNAAFGRLTETCITCHTAFRPTAAAPR